MENLAEFSAREVKRAGVEERERRVFFCRRTVRVEVKGKAISTTFLKIERRGLFVGVKDRKKRYSDRIGK